MAYGLGLGLGLVGEVCRCCFLNVLGFPGAVPSLYTMEFVRFFVATGYIYIYTPVRG